jgi:hypothetical protein
MGFKTVGTEFYEALHFIITDFPSSLNKHVDVTQQNC